MNEMKHSLSASYRYCLELVRRHYENFPVASFFIPKHLRPAVAVIYAFARTADDFADEGTRMPEERLRALDEWERKLDACDQGTVDHPVFIALADVLSSFHIPKQLLSDLLTAFRMDVTTNRYETFDDLLNYCKHSANPVGRTVLHIFDDMSERKALLSDNVCTALQLTNFWQDVRSDAERGRIYLPLEDMRRFGYTEHELLSATMNPQFAELLRYQVERTRRLFALGRPLIDEVVPQLRFEMKLTWSGGMRILDKIERSGFDVLRRRPVLGLKDKLTLAVRAMLPTDGGRS